MKKCLICLLVVVFFALKRQEDSLKFSLICSVFVIIDKVVELSLLAINVIAINAIFVWKEINSLWSE